MGFTSEQLEKQAARRAAWLAAEEEETAAAKARVEEAERKNSDTALRLVMLCWLVAILAIFYHVKNMIDRGAQQAALDEWELPASEQLMHAFRQQRNQL